LVCGGGERPKNSKIVLKIATNQLNGNIAGNKWRSKGNGKQRAYGFGNDAANRLLFLDFNQYGSAWDKTAGVDFSSTMGDGVNADSAYDENGNILAMKQMAWQLGGSQAIDLLSYTYTTNSNKLKNVIDGANNPATTLGDFRTSSLSPYSSNKTNAAVDYTYDVNGNLTRDLNKDIGSQTTDGIIYNHLNLPWKITVRSATGTKGTITYIYDATGNKLKKTTLDSAGGLQTVTTYIGAFQYQGKQALGSGTTPADTLQFFGQEEGRVRVTTDTTGGQNTTGFKYDYFLKDHLGNTRMVLTDEQQTDRYPAATMEIGDSATENLYYTMLDNTRTSLPAGYPTDTTTNPNNYVARLNGGTAGPKIGPGITLKVMAGDQFSIKVSSWYRLNGSSPGTPASPVTDIVSALINGIGAIPGGGHPSTANLQANSTPLTSNVMEFLGDTGTNILQTKPHAFVNWILFDNQFNYVAASSGFDQVGADQELHQHILVDLPVISSGYLYIYTSNETPNVDVFFDNLQVTHVRGPMLEEDHYYPFGLTMAGISDKALKSQYAVNRFKSNGGSELQNQEFSDGSGLESYDAVFRMYDPQIGRFWQQDPLGEWSESWSPYSFVLDNPISFNDPIGLEDSVKPMAPVTVTPSNNAPPCCQVQPVIDPSTAGAYPLPVEPPTEVPPLTVVPPSEPSPGPGLKPGVLPEIVPPAILTVVFVAIPITGTTHWVNHDEMFWPHHPELQPNAWPREVRNKPIDDVYLARFGDFDSQEKLATDAQRAQAAGFPHGVSTAIRPKRPINGRAAKLLDVMKVFEVRKTGAKADHFTVVLPNPVTQQVADEFNALFTKQEP